ncbi:restriction system protein [Arthrobacter subterraneus]|uniref:Restriction system protein n=1 Tax=Arthrobacter subterraneus TaxID=335973 RepID=A0A1G8NFD3_9MICC|nr:restriction endonuclease [Arthrobacter subterraneus]SDI78981.1 restriction system protein [Arthrobacter subterraneus]
MSDESAVPLPRWQDFMIPVLRVLQNGKVWSRRDLIAATLDEAGMTQEQRSIMLKGGDPSAENRISWAISDLTRAQAIVRPARGLSTITETGLKLLAEHPDGLDRSHLEVLPAYAEYQPLRAGLTKTSVEVQSKRNDEERDPIQQVEDGIDRVQAEVGAELLQRLRAMDPSLFEQTVVELLLKMGYGGAEQRGKRIGGTGDGGVDGVIDQDALGLDQIYIQAKRYKEGSNVGRETIQAFVGALHGAGASRGVFITTSSFTDHARTYAAGIPSRVILIDSVRLVNLMIKYRVGVQVKQTYDVVDLDEDYFE